MPLETLSETVHAIVLIPARMASTRLPGKPLADIAGVPMIVHVWRRAVEAEARPCRRGRDRRTVRSRLRSKAWAGARSMTRADHVSGSDRIFEALGADPQGRYEIVVNVQGDLPTIDARDVSAALVSR